MGFSSHLNQYQVKTFSYKFTSKIFLKLTPSSSERSWSDKVQDHHLLVKFGCLLENKIVKMSWKG